MIGRSLQQSDIARPASSRAWIVLTSIKLKGSGETTRNKDQPDPRSGSGNNETGKSGGTVRLGREAAGLSRLFGAGVMWLPGFHGVFGRGRRSVLRVPSRLRGALGSPGFSGGRFGSSRPILKAPS